MSGGDWFGAEVSATVKEATTASAPPPPGNPYPTEVSATVEEALSPSHFALASRFY